MQYVSELRIFGFPWAPKGWVVCDGRLLSIAREQALFALLGTTYGGDGVTNFALPDLRMKVPMHVGPGINLGQTGGETKHQLLIAEMPSHTHNAVASPNSPSVGSPSNAFWAKNTGATPYGSPGSQTMSPAAVIPTGDGVPHENMSPYLILNICICLNGVFPTHG